jgi:hypothetical protein
MKKLILALVAVSVASLSYAGAGCSGCTGDKAADTKAPTEKKAEETKA